MPARPGAAPCSSRRSARGSADRLVGREGRLISPWSRWAQATSGTSASAARPTRDASPATSDDRAVDLGHSDHARLASEDGTRSRTIADLRALIARGDAAAVGAVRDAAALMGELIPALVHFDNPARGDDRRVADRVEATCGRRAQRRLPARVPLPRRATSCSPGGRPLRECAGLAGRPCSGSSGGCRTTRSARSRPTDPCQGATPLSVESAASGERRDERGLHQRAVEPRAVDERQHLQPDRRRNRRPRTAARPASRHRRAGSRKPSQQQHARSPGESARPSPRRVQPAPWTERRADCRARLRRRVRAASVVVHALPDPA